MSGASVTIKELAEHRLGRPAVSGGDFDEANLAILGGCEICGASIAAYNGCPSKTGFWRCLHGCIADQGWTDVREADLAIFGREESE